MKTTKRLSAYYATPDSAKLYYEVHGDSGPILVFSNGIACPINHWHNQVEYFSKNNRVLVYDLRGHHKSSNGLIKKITMDLLAHDVMGIVEQAFGADQTASFWGHSYGVPISLKVASLNPKICNSLVLVNGFYKNPFDEYISTKQSVEIIEALKIFSYSAPEFSNWAWANAADSKLFRIITGWVGGFNAERMPVEDMEIYSRAVASMHLPTFFNHFKALLRFDFSDEASSVKCPALIVHGERDELIPEEQNKTLAEIVQKGFFVNVKEGSHCTQLDLPQRLNSIVEEFLNVRVIKKLNY
jgi:pimeloyl-ACP methyl ester carboxylesterase